MPLVSVCFILVFTAGSLFCADKAPAQELRDLKIVTSFYPVYIMARNVIKDIPGVSVTNLTPPLSGCLHDYALTNHDMKKLADAQVLMVNGAGMESFLDKVIAQHPHLQVISISHGMPLIKGQGNQGENPHVWVSVSLAMIQVENLGRAMEELDPARQSLYERNTAVYLAKLEDLRRRMHEQLGPYKGRPMITFHEAFPYFAREFGFEIASVIEREPGSEPSAKDLAQTVDLIKKNNISALFSEPQYPASAAQVIARETGVEVYVLDPAVTGPDNDDAYITIMENNLKVLKQAFEKSTAIGKP